MENRIDFLKNDVLKISFSTLIIRVQSIVEKFGALEDFAEKFDLYGVSNGKLLLMTEMMEPPNDLIQKVETCLLPSSFQEKEDFIIAYEQMPYGIKRESSPLPNSEHPACREIKWLSSIIHPEGNYVWLKEENTSEKFVQQINKPLAAKYSFKKLKDSFSGSGSSELKTYPVKEVRIREFLEEDDFLPLFRKNDYGLYPLNMKPEDFEGQQIAVLYQRAHSGHQVGIGIYRIENGAQIKIEFIQLT